jgi:hypothetical protein
MNYLSANDGATRTLHAVTTANCEAVFKQVLFSQSVLLTTPQEKLKRIVYPCCFDYPD